MFLRTMIKLKAFGINYSSLETEVDPSHHTFISAYKTTYPVLLAVLEATHGLLLRNNLLTLWKWHNLFIIVLSC